MLTDCGLLRPSMLADLVPVDGDPTNDIHDTRNLTAVRKRAIRLEPAEPPG